jgi:hypothetical protein
MELLKFVSTSKSLISPRGLALKEKFYIAVKTDPPTPKIEVVAPENSATPISNWGIVAAILISAMPHLWQWLNGHQKARNNLTETLLQKLSDSYALSTVSNTTFRQMLEDVAERPTRLAEQNAQALRDLQGEVADLRGQVLQLIQKNERLASIVTREAQKP